MVLYKIRFLHNCHIAEEVNLRQMSSYEFLTMSVTGMIVVLKMDFLHLNQILVPNNLFMTRFELFQHSIILIAEDMR